MTIFTEPRVVPTEDSWNLWFACLPCWDKHTVLRNELQWHDGFIDGTYSFEQLRTMIDCAQGRPSESPTV